MALASPRITSPGSSRMTPIEWLVCGIAGWGFAFDLYESLMTALIVGPAVTTLGGFQAGTPDFNLWVGLFFFVPTVAGGVFGLLGGYLADRFGRRRVLMWSILLYSGAAAAAAHAGSLPLLLVLRSVTLMGVFVEAVAAIAWLAELFPEPRRRERVLSWTQACYPVGGLLVGGAYFLAVTYADSLPEIRGSHDPWRYTLLSGLIPALPLIVLRPFLPESPLWQARRVETSRQPLQISELLRPGMRITVIVTALLAACTLAIQYGALQHTPRIVPGIVGGSGASPREVQQIVSGVFTVQEMGSVCGRLLFTVMTLHIVSRRRLLRIYLAPSLLMFAWLMFYGVGEGIVTFAIGVFFAQVLFNCLHSFWGNYLPRVFPTRLRATGESVALNLGGRVLAVSAAMATTQLSNTLPAPSVSLGLAYSAGVTAVVALVAALVISHWLPEPAAPQLPE